MAAPHSHPLVCDALCIGGINIDRKLKALQALHSGSSNACIVNESPGGVARNVAENLARLGLQVGLCGQVGSDATAQAVLKPLQALGIDTRACLVAQSGSTGSYTAILDPQGQLVLGMADMALTEMLTPQRIEQACDWAYARLWMADMNLPASSLEWIAQQAKLQNKRLVMLAVSEPKMNRLPADLHGVDSLVLNRGELAALSPTQASIDATFAKLHAAGLKRLVMTMGDQGLQCIEAGQTKALSIPLQLPAHFNLVDVSGAGDALCAGLCASYLRYPDDSLAQHATRAMRLSVITVQSAETVSPAITPDLI